MKKNIRKIAKPGENKLISLLKFASFIFSKPGLDLLIKIAGKPFSKPQVEYSKWINARTNPALLKKEYEDTINKLGNRPLISVVLRVSNQGIAFLPATIDSVTGQSYQHWELCIAASGSITEQVKSTLESYGKKDRRIKVEFDTHRLPVSADLNTALSIASGEYLLFMEQGDLLTSHCLFEFVRHINEHPSDRLIYADDDTVNEKGEFSMPRFKPDWSPDSLLCRNYIGLPFAIKKGLPMQSGDVQNKLEYNYYYDILLRATDLTKHSVGHIPKILYHSRVDNLQDKYDSAHLVLQAAMERRNIPADILKIQGVAGAYAITYKAIFFDKVSIIIPAKDHAQLLKTVVDSIIEKTNYPHYEIIVINNNSVSGEFFQLIAGYEQQYPGKFRCINAGFPFNFSRLINLGVSVSTGTYVLMLNNDMEVIDSDWMTKMVSYARQERTGAVGAKLLYPDNTIQHAGIILGGKDATSHIYPNMDRYDSRANCVNNYSAVTGACLMCRKDLYNEVGGMDERLPVEYNDVDLCLKLLSKGYYNVYLPMVELYHYESATRGHPFRSKKAWEQHNSDLAVFKSKWQKIIDRDPYYNPGSKILLPGNVNK